MPKRRKFKKRKDIDVAKLTGFDFIKTNKDNIINVIINKAHLITINEFVARVNKIVINAYQYIKLYLIHLFDNNKTFPKLDEAFIGDVFRILSSKQLSVKTSLKLKDLISFYDDYFAPLIDKNDIQSYKYMRYTLQYEAIDMKKNIYVNIQEHFIEHLNYYIYIMLDVKTKRNKITSDNKDKEIRKVLHTELTHDINNVLTDLTNFEEPISKPEYHKFIKNERKNIYGNKTQFTGDTVFYEIKCDDKQHDYLRPLFYIHRKLEEKYNEIHEQNKFIEETNLIIKEYNDIAFSQIMKDNNELIEIIEYKSKFIDTFKECAKALNNSWTNTRKVQNTNFMNLRNKNSKLFDVIKINKATIKTNLEIIKFNKQFGETIDDRLVDMIVKCQKQNYNMMQTIRHDRNIVKMTNLTISQDNTEINYHTKNNKRTMKKYEKLNFENKLIIHNLKTREALKTFPKIKQIKLFNVVPLRTSIISKHITIDTQGLIWMFYSGDHVVEYIEDCKDDKDETLKLWGEIFNLDKKVFKNKKQNKKIVYQFHHMIRTDGVSISVLFERLNPDGSVHKQEKSKIYGIVAHTPYIEKTLITTDLKTRKIVCIDPNMQDIIYCGSKNKNNKLETFRYTQNQRRLEIGTKKYSKIMDEINKKPTIVSKTLTNETIKSTVKEIETELSKFNSRTTNMTEFKKYIKAKNIANSKLFSHYSQTLFRKFKLNRFINTQKSEAKLVSKFGNKFGKPNVKSIIKKVDTSPIIVMGDYDNGTNNLKGCEPVICKKIRRILKNAGYEVYMINEFRTSVICNRCHEKLDKFLKRKSSKPNSRMEEILVHGLLRHTDEKPEGEQEAPICKIIHNRDKNAVQNMIYIVKEIMRTGIRPAPFRRDNT
ncbi:MAG: hypothetical protein Gaeavirus3_2 [Gaeavirus sp.]|uniref:Transposase n=1 Tax=Gaeavirus sp. TaxID=2487767 RepID=A0A3G4ZYF5_9VIRU|nr:MAG: hypothetical protein Gaeavirus3_2 [Gaeavirus sp.]